MIVEILATTAPLLLAYYLASVGHSIIEKSGILDLAIDGVFVLGVAVSYAYAYYTGNDVSLALSLSLLAGLLIGLFISFIVTKLPVSHGAIGLSLMFLCYGLASLIGLPARTKQGLYGGSVGLELAGYSWIYVYAFILAFGIAIHLLIEKTKIGVMIRAVGEDPYSAESLGVNVLYTRLLAGLVGFALIGIGGGVFELFYLRGVWREGTGVGHGWIAFAISLSSGRHPVLNILSATLFAILFEYRYTIVSYGIPRELADALPFITAILAIIVYMATPLRYKLAPPKSLGKPYFREERTI